MAMKDVPEMGTFETAGDGMRRCLDETKRYGVNAYCYTGHL